MVAGFHRSFSLPGSPRPKTGPASEKSYHVRSISLPCRSHPLISQLEYEIRSANAWHSTKPEPESGSGSASASWICDGLARLDLLHASLADLLKLPQHQHSLRRGSGSGSASAWSDRVLDDFLRLADAHGSFRSEMVAMSEIQSETQSAIRRKDAARLPSCVRSMKRIEKELVKLAGSLREVSKSPAATTRFAIGSVEEAELAGIVREVIGATVTVTVAVFSEAAAVVAGVTAAVGGVTAAKDTWTPLRRLSRTASRLGKMSDEGEDCRRRKAIAMEKLGGREAWIGAVESMSERLFRCLVNARVNLLNILTL